ncbi:MAG: YggS family pyridoxal phosphate-dependent enzyme [Lachnospiraceae bacterium]|nr:YggS family pyridoxal phosphate-dependent enzyme [Lachnospiraceae bacterium]
MSTISKNISLVRENIATACKKSGRNIEEVTLIAVSKTKPVDMLKDAFDAGAIDFGENKVQELCDKIEHFQNEHMNWHMIGHLQTNKVKYIVDKVCLIHSVDSIKLALQIDKEAEKKGVIANILLEVNVAEEESKFGLTCENVEDLVKEISKLSNIRVKGLMTVAPYTENAEENRVYFRKLKQLSVDIKTKNIDNVSMDILSMGMTNDYMIAIEEGSTHVRVGTGIFGDRDYTKIS